MKPRPTGITLLALAFGWLTLSSASSSAISFSLYGSSFFSVTGSLILANTAAAGFTAVGLWFLRDWAATSLRLWMAICAAFFVWFVVGPTHGLGTSPIGLATFAPIVAGLFWLLDRYVSRTLQPTP